MFGLPMGHIILLLIVGVLIFGKRLPEVARQVAKILVELKKGWAGIEENLTTGRLFDDHDGPRRDATPPPPPPRPPQRIQPTGPKFEDGPDTPSAPIV